MQIFRLYTAIAFILWPLLVRADTTDKAKSWLKPPPTGLQWEEWKVLPAENIYEVVASKERVAVEIDLASKEIIPITDVKAQYFTGKYFKCPTGLKTFLVRTVYGQGGTGEYSLHRRGDDLLIFHSSLGHTSLYTQSAIVVNLSFIPENIYREVEISE